MNRRFWLLLLAIVLAFSFVAAQEEEEQRGDDDAPILDLSNLEPPSASIDLLNENEEENEEEAPQEEPLDANDEDPSQSEHQEQDSSEQPEGMMDLWEKYMSEFDPSDIVSFELGGSEEDVFIENVHDTPTELLGAYFVSSSENSEVDLFVIGPDGVHLFGRTDKNEGFFHLNATKKGTYQFFFSNSRWFETKKVTFAYHSSVARNISSAGTTALDPLNEKLYKANKEIRSLHAETKFSYMRAETHFETLRNAHTKLLLFTILESFVIVAASLWQIYYIRKLLENKRII
eukprot:TRINITY_DN4532_c0_g1_i2.p1 TRINITY_DN4532_c0_g1~~TRINITY_DN4532_c0_g1_i2.p1  ORF type:complete len:289 (+),score=78.59 TRINITY_DN4532_c0_g1_i2:100-966(+)